MKYIQLTQGMQTAVDDDLYDWLNQWKWRYAKRVGGRKGGDVVRTLHGYDNDGINKVVILKMASILCPVAPGFVVDHIDRDPLNNQRSNLRRATYRMNVLNTSARSNNRTGEKHIHWAHAKQRYVVQLPVSLGHRSYAAFKTIEEAILYRDKKLKGIKQ